MSRGVACGGTRGGHVPPSPRWGYLGHRHKDQLNALTLKMYFANINTSIKANFSYNLQNNY